MTDPVLASQCRCLCMNEKSNLGGRKTFWFSSYLKYVLFKACLPLDVENQLHHLLMTSVGMAAKSVRVLAPF